MVRHLVRGDKVNWAIMRHGEAGRAAIDADRRLTVSGREVVVDHARRLSDTAFHPRTIVSSSLVRARETAALVRETAFPDASMLVDDALVPSGIRQGVVGLLMAQVLGAASDCAQPDILLVSHQPLIGDLVAELTGRLVSIHPGTIVGMMMDMPSEGMSSDQTNNGDSSLTWVID